VSFEPYYDQSDLITAAVKTVANALILAFIFIIIVLALFLMNLRATLLVVISIPISIGIALMIMSWLGLSANLMSLGGIAVAIGMLVDGSVVMVENMFKHLSHPDARHDEKHKDENDPHDVAHDVKGIPLRLQEAGKEVVRPIFFASLIILVVFMPMFSFQGVEAKLFQPMAISIMLALVSAVFVALIIVPALATFVFKSGIKARKSFIVEPLLKWYKTSLAWSMRNAKIVLIGAFLLLAISLVLLPRLGTEFVPELEEGTINLRVTLAPSASLDTALAVSPKLEAMLMEFPEVTYALSRIGRPEVGGDPEPVNNIEIYIGLKPVSEWTSATNRIDLQQLMELKLEKFPGLLFNFSQPIATRVDELLSGVRAQLAIKLFGPDLKVLAATGQEIEAAVKTVDGARDVAMEQIVGESQLVIKPDRRQLSRYGISVSDVMSVVRDGLGGQSAGQIINGNERYDIYVRLANEFRDKPQNIAELRLIAPGGAWVRLGDVASIEIESGPPQVRRDDVQR
ncbi:Cobalt-zinc-cadmium resistance protein CzcA; Cation efflux system protein CusA, partial [hydrothermal vent metagenome]